jgi:hypothetical protein
MAALVGAIPGHDFGSERNQGHHFGFGFSPYDPYSHSMGYGFGDVYGDDAGFGDVYGDDYGFGAPPVGPATAPRPPHPAHMRRAAAMRRAGMHADPTSTYHRTMLLDPNRNSTVKVERYSFSFSPAAALVLGTASAIASFTAQPSTSIKGQRVITNAPSPGFVTLASLQIANVNVFVGTTEDAFSYSSLAQGVMLDLPRLDPQNRATASGNYTGVLPAGFTAGASFTFIITLQGPSTLAGGYGQ